jgi:predicted TIM-barrel fold metal-dependent hydrolase
MPEVKKSLANIYFDSAASPYLYSPGVYEHTSGLVGIEKVLFGTDYPLLTPKRLLTQIKTLKLDEYSKQKILSQNALELLGIKNTG